MNYYCGHSAQIRGAEQYTLHGGKGEGMHFIYVRNGLGLELWISADRAGDVSRLQYKGRNFGYFAPCGYVAPSYYDGAGAGFLKSFTAGFFTTCGLTAVGSPCVDEGEKLPLHGTLSNTPAELIAIEESNDALQIKLRVIDAALFARKLVLERTYHVSYAENLFSVRDIVTNQGDTRSPYMILYHCNMGYPLLSEQSVLRIPHHGITPRNAHAAEHISTALQPETPQAEYEERCYYYDVAEQDGVAKVGIFGPEAGGVVLSYNKAELPCFTQWKMMGRRDYVMGLEPGNCTPDGRDVLRREGRLQFLSPDESGTTALTFRFIDTITDFEGGFQKCLSR